MTRVYRKLGVRSRTELARWWPTAVSHSTRSERVVGFTAMPPPVGRRTVWAMALGTGRTFFVESYIPQLDVAGVAALSSRLQKTVEQLQDEGLSLAWIRSFALLEEDTFVWMVEATELDHVDLIQRRAGVELAHVVEVVPGE